MPDLKSMTVEELVDQSIYTRFAAQELARRLKEAQQETKRLEQERQLSEKDWQTKYAEAKAEALEELTAGLDRDEFVSVRTIRQKARHETFNAAEYRAKAGRKT